MATPAKRSFQLIGAGTRPLHGDLRSAGGIRPTVVICHGSGGHRDWAFLPELADRLARAGLAVVSFDFSDPGTERTRPHTEVQLRELEIVLEAVQRGKVGAPAETYGLIGYDTGGELALLRSAGDERVRALVTLAAMAGFGDGDRARDILIAAHAVRAPWLLVHGTADESVLAQDARALHGAAPRDSVEILLVDGGSHTFGTQHPWAGSNPGLDQLVRASVDWLSRHLA